MKIDSYKKQQLVKIGRHEVAHYIIAKKLGFETGSISLEVTHIPEGHLAGAEITLFKNLDSIENVTSYIKRRVVILYAGVLGESLEKGIVNEKYACDELNKGAANDFAKCRELLQILNNITSSASSKEEANANLQSINNELWSEAIKLVQEAQEAIEGLGSRLAFEIDKIGEKVVLENREIEELPAIKAWLTQNRT